jgi:glucan phosphoethanolaminetransferase (alkaline phosphatase superfamily)
VARGGFAPPSHEVWQSAYNGDAVVPPFRRSIVTSPDVTQMGVSRTHVAHDSRRTVARLRRWVARLLFFAPGVAVVGYDLSLNAAMLVAAGGAAKLQYVRAAAVTTLLWGFLVMAAIGRRGALRWGARVALVVLPFVAIGGQLYTYGRYKTFLTTSAMLMGTNMLPSVRQQLWYDHESFLIAVVPPLVIALAMALAQRRLAPPRYRPRALAVDAAAILLCFTMVYEPPDDTDEVAPFDTLYMRGVGQLAKAVWDHHPVLARVHPGPRTPIAVPPLAARPKATRNVLFILTESVRAMSTCVAYDPDCQTTPFSNAAAKDRIPLLQMRSVDSTTAISLGVMWSGITPTETREALHSAPLVWEYANAAHVDTAYWTSQNLLFGNSGAWLQGVAWGHSVSATELDPDASLETGSDDNQLATYVDSQLASLHEPFFAVVHLSNTHMPYAIADDDAPFQPQGPDSGWRHTTEVANRYADAVYHQDRATARVVEAVRRSPAGARTVVVYLSDHGEQLYEHGAFGHTGTMYDQELHIPAWVDAPEGTLTESERESLRALRDTPVTTNDVLPTLLDLVGVLDDPALTPFSRTFVGQSLLRGGSPSDAPVLLTNCTELWACAFRNWGVMNGSHKLFGMQGDAGWKCYDLANDPEEQHLLDPHECGDLVPFAESSLHGRPF